MREISYPRLAARIFNVPLIVHPRHLLTSVNGLSHRFGLQPLAMEDDEGSSIDMSPERPMLIGALAAEPVKTAGGPYYRTSSGVSIISVVGALVGRFDWLASACGYVSYEEIATQFEAAMADPLTRSIVLDIDSPGGEVGGIVALGNQIMAGRDQKPSIAVANSLAASGGYWLASACSEIVVSPESMVGSIGVVGMHVDQSGQDEQRGLKFTPVYAGAHKIDGWSHAPLTPDAKSEWQSEVDELYGLFVGTVAANRGMDPDAVRATEARVLLGQPAVAAGLADRVGTLNQVVAELAVRDRSSPRSSAAASTQESKTMTITADVIRTEHPAIAETFRQEGVKSERERVSAILNSDQAKGREVAAMTFATQTNMAAPEALAVLGTLPSVAKVDPKGQQPFQTFQQAMGETRNPQIGTEGPQTDPDSPEALAADVQATAALFGKMTGSK